MKIYNTLTRKKEEIKPISERKISYYTCGPTVYDVAHIGNLRTYIFEDLLKRSLMYEGYEVKHVMNVTDIDDKTIKKSEGKKGDFSNLTSKYEGRFFADLMSLNILSPNEITRPTEYIDKIVDFILELIAKGYAYKASDGSVYFSIEKFKDYGKLSQLDKEGIKAGARVNQDEYDKENPADFALWKAWDEKDGEIYWETKLGKGRPGWSIECSVMSQDKLGETLDIHAGAVDLIFPHHENEIAQSESKMNKKFVNYWVHGEHLLVDGKKMSKSLGNLFTLDNLNEKGFSALDFRYLVIGSHYRSKLNFTWDALAAAKNARERLSRLFSESKEQGSLNKRYMDEFLSFIKEDLNTPRALAVVWEMMRDEKLSSSEKTATLAEMDQILGLKLSEGSKSEIPQKVIDLAEDRKKARENKDFNRSDDLRTKITESGFSIEDLPNNEYKIVSR